VDRSDDGRLSRYCFGPMILATKLAHVPASLSSRATAFVAICWIPWSVAHWRPRFGETWSCMAVLSSCARCGVLVFFELVKEVGSSRSVSHLLQYRSRRRARRRRLHETLTRHYLRLSLVLVGCIFATSRSKEPRRPILGVLSATRRDRRPPASEPAHGRADVVGTRNRPCE